VVAGGSSGLHGRLGLEFSLVLAVALWDTPESLGMDLGLGAHTHGPTCLPCFWGWDHLITSHSKEKMVLRRRWGKRLIPRGTTCAQPRAPHGLLQPLRSHRAVLCMQVRHATSDNCLCSFTKTEGTVPSGTVCSSVNVNFNSDPIRKGKEGKGEIKKSHSI
jgi:hypothetical protein